MENKTNENPVINGDFFFDVYYLEPKATMYVSNIDAKNNTCYYKVEHQVMGNPHVSLLERHEINISECTQEDIEDKPVFDHQSRQIFFGGVGLNQDGEVDEYFPGICLVKSQKEGFLPFNKSAKELRSLEPYARLILKDFGTVQQCDEECFDEQTMVE